MFIKTLGTCLYFSVNVHWMLVIHVLNVPICGNEGACGVTDTLTRVQIMDETVFHIALIPLRKIRIHRFFPLAIGKSKGDKVL